MFRRGLQFPFCCFVLHLTVLCGACGQFCIYNQHTLADAGAMPKEKIINFRIDGALKREAKELAEADGRSLSNWITQLIAREIRRAKKRD